MPNHRNRNQKLKRAADGPEQRSVSRIRFLTLLIIGVCFTVVFVKLFFMQVLHYDFYTEKAKSLQTRDTIVTPLRGTIYDSNMKVLAASAATETINVNPQNVVSSTKEQEGVTALEQQQALAKMLAEKLDLNYETVLKKVQRTDKQYQLIKSKVEKDVMDEINAEIEENGYTGVETTPDTSRYYPFGSLAAQVLGFVNADGDGVIGLEAKYNDTLNGSPGRVVRAQNAQNQDMPYEYEEYIEAEDGDSLVLTLDTTIQSVLEKHLETARQDNPSARGGVAGIIMNVKTGEVLAMASLPTFDLNSPYVITDSSVLNTLSDNIDAYLEENNLVLDVPQSYLEKGSGLSDVTSNSDVVSALENLRYSSLNQLWRNKISQDTYEPGSTFKLFTVATGVETGVVSSSSNFFCAGYKMIDGWDEKINCWKNGGHGAEDLTHALMNSCNPAMMEISLKIGTPTFYEYFKAFGMLETTGIDLPAESNSLFHDEDSFSKVDMAVGSFGQSFTVTPLQLINMVCAIVDDGKLKTPHLVKEVIGEDGTVKQTTSTEYRRQVISEETSAYLREAMEMVVKEGTAANAYVAGYRVGGKTATSEILPRGQDRYTASFVGVAPMDDPQIACLVIVSDMPSSVMHGGGAVAAPVVGRIFEEVLPYWGIEPVYDADETNRKDVAVPTLTGMTEEEAEAALAAVGLTYRASGSGTTVTDQIPAGGVKIPGGSKVVLYMNTEKPTDTITVPNLIDHTYDTAQTMMSERGLYLKCTGIPTAKYSYLTHVTKQSPAAGTEVSRGTVITVVMTNSSASNDSTE